MAISQEFKDTSFSVIMAIVGNFFPFWWGWIFLHFLNSWNGWESYGKISDLLIIAAAFMTTTTYLLYRNRKEVRWFIWLLLFLGGLTNATLFTLYSIKENIIKEFPFASDLNKKTTWALLILSIFLFAYTQYKENERQARTTPNKARDDSYDDLEGKFNLLNNGK